jgi:hypothetical protein
VAKESVQPEDATVDPTKDWFLQILVNLSNTAGLGIGITLQVGGLLVSGTLSGGKEYFEAFSSDLASAFTQDGTGESIKETFARCGEVYESSEEGKGMQDRPSYIHLRDARFFFPGSKPIPTDKGIWWRGRISEVSGFVLGALSFGEA